MRVFWAAMAVGLTGCSAITDNIAQRYGTDAARTANHAIADVVTAGPTGAATVGLSDGALEGGLAVGFYGTALGARRPALPGGYRVSDLPSIATSDLVLVLGAEGGWMFRREAAFAAAHLGAGWSLVSGGMRLTGAYDGDELGFAIGPEVIAHVRLDGQGRENELQAFLRADFFVGNRRRYDHQYLVGARFVWDVY